MSVDPKEAPPVDDENLTEKKKRRGTLFWWKVINMKEPQDKHQQEAFKDPICKDKTCLGCNAKPPTLSTKTIRKISSTLCDLDAAQITDGALSKRKKGKAAPVGPAPPKKDEDPSKKNAKDATSE